MPISDEQKSRITSAVVPALGAFVLPSPSLLSDLAAIEAIDARKMQTRHGARAGGTMGMYAAIPMLAYALSKGKINLRGAKNIYKTYAKNIALPIGLGTGAGAWIWHGPPGVSQEQQKIMREIKSQLSREADVRSVMDKTSENPSLGDKILVSAVTPASAIFAPGVPIGTATVGAIAPKKRKAQTIAGYTVGRKIGQVPGIAAAAYLSRAYFKNPSKIKKDLAKHVDAVGRVVSRAPKHKRLNKIVGIHSKKMLRSPAMRKVIPLLTVGEAIGGTIGFSVGASKKKSKRKRKAMIKTSALPNLLKAIKVAKSQGIPIDPVKEKALKKISAGIKKDVQGSQK